MKEKFITVITAVLLSSFASFCAAEKATMDTDAAWYEIYTAVDFKEKECGGKPSYPIVVFQDPDAYAVRLCSLSILREVCPFQNYPLFCLEMLGADIPLIGP